MFKGRSVHNKQSAIQAKGSLKQNNIIGLTNVWIFDVDATKTNCLVLKSDALWPSQKSSEQKGRDGNGTVGSMDKLKRHI